MNHNIVEIGSDSYVNIADISIDRTNSSIIDLFSENKGFNIKYSFNPYGGKGPLSKISRLFGGFDGINVELVELKEPYELNYVYIRVSEDRVDKLTLNYGRPRYVSPVPINNTISLMLPFSKSLDKVFMMDYCTMTSNIQITGIENLVSLKIKPKNTMCWSYIPEKQTPINIPMELLEKQSDVLYDIMLLKKEATGDMVYEFENISHDVFNVIRKYMTMRELDKEIKRCSSDMDFVYQLHKIVREFKIKGLYHVSASLVKGYEPIN